MILLFINNLTILYWLKPNSFSFLELKINFYRIYNTLMKNRKNDEKEYHLEGWDQDEDEF